MPVSSPQRQPVESSSLAAIGYCTQTQTLDVDFRHGAVYRYFDVPLQTYQAFVAADSKGRYFNQAIKGAFSYQPIAR